MARVDKTVSALNTRAQLAVAWSEADIGEVTPVGINASGLAVKGAGQTGVIGVMIPQTKYDLAAGAPQDVFSTGEIVEVEGLAAGNKYYSDAAGVISTTNTGTYLGYTVEADRLVLRMA